MTAAPPRPRFRWSLRTMFVVVTALGLLLGWASEWPLRPDVAQIPFVSAAWKQATPIERSRTVRSQMIQDLLRRTFRGPTRDEIEQELGKPDSCNGFEQWDTIYVLGLERDGPSSLDVEALGFKFDVNDRVIDFGLSGPSTYFSRRSYKQ